MINFKISEEELRILTDTYASEIRDNSSDLPNTKYVTSEMLWDSDWNSLFNEPVFQILYHDYDEDVMDTDQFMICRDIKGFSREDDSEDELVSMYEMKESESNILFDMYIKDFLNSAELATAKQLKEANEYNKYIIDILFEIEYDKKYNDDERMELYELLDDDRFLSNEARELFLF